MPDGKRRLEGAGMEEDPIRDALLVEYAEVNQNYRALADTRFKLLALIPSLGAIALFLLSRVQQGESEPKLDDRSPARGSTLRRCARGSLLPRSIPKQQRRSDKQRDEEPIQGQDFGHGANAGLVLPGDQRDHGDQRLSERRREQRACHSRWPEARDDGTDDSDGEHADIHQVGEVARMPDDANGKGHPDEDECCRERNADGSSVRGSVRLHRFLRGRGIGSRNMEGAGSTEKYFTTPTQGPSTCSSSRKGAGPDGSRRVAQRHHRSKGRERGTSPAWAIFRVLREVPRIPYF